MTKLGIKQTDDTQAMQRVLQAMAQVLRDEWHIPVDDPVRLSILVSNQGVEIESCDPKSVTEPLWLLREAMNNRYAQARSFPAEVKQNPGPPPSACWQYQEQGRLLDQVIRLLEGKDNIFERTGLVGLPPRLDKPGPLAELFRPLIEQSDANAREALEMIHALHPSISLVPADAQLQRPDGAAGRGELQGDAGPGKGAPEETSTEGWPL